MCGATLILGAASLRSGLTGAGIALIHIHRLSYVQGSFDQVQDELPLSDPSDETGAFALQVGIDPLEEFLYALSLLRPSASRTPEILGTNTPEQKARKEITCELLFFELAAVGFLGIAAVLFKEKGMGVIRVHAILPLLSAP